MAGEDRKTTYSVALQGEPYKFDFFQALRRLECLSKDKPRIGESLHARDDLVRLAQKPSMSFAPSTLASFEPGRVPPRLAVYFLGLFGPNGPLPLHLTEYAMERLRDFRDPTLIAFLNIFHHRILMMFYRSWAQAQPAVNMDRPDSERFSCFVGSLFGLGMPSVRNCDAFPDLAKLFHAGHLVCQNRYPDGLRSMLANFFKLPVTIEEFVGQWLHLPEEYHWKLGRSRETGSMGNSAIVGARVWDRQQKFRIVLGPLSFKDYQRMLPGGDALPRLAAIVFNYIGYELVWDLKLVLKKEEIPRFQLGKFGRLGWTTWAPRRKAEKDVGDLCLQPFRHVVQRVRHQERLQPAGA